MSTREAIILPGGMFGPFAPLLMFSADAAERRGAQVTPVSWDEPDRPLTLTPQERGPWVLDQFKRAVPSVPEGALLIAKSLGRTLRRLPLIWGYRRSG
jgi:hypothetical protein